MPVDHFTKKEFEDALPVHKVTGKALWRALGLESGEYAYLVLIEGDDKVGIEVRSSVGPSGESADVGEDSIRAWLIDRETSKPLGSKVARWTTRQAGWQERMTDVLRTLYFWRKSAGDCPTCHQPKRIFKVKKDGPTHGKVFAKCDEHGGFTWLPEKYDGSQPKAALAPNTLAGQIKVIADKAGVLPWEETPEDGEKPALTVVVAPDPAPEKPAPVIVSPAKMGTPNPQQQAAIETPVNTPVRVLAGPGSGKTFVIRHRYAFIKAGIDPEKILAVTFSKTMADELKNKVTATSPEIGGTQAANQLCTIHALCFRILKAEGDKREVAKEWQIKKAFQEIAERLWPFAQERPGYQELEYWVNGAKGNGLTTADDLNFFLRFLGSTHGPRLHECRRDFDRALTSQGLITFPDMLLDVEQRLVHDRTFRERWQAKFQVVMVDEAQDVSRQALRILITLSLDPGQTLQPR